MVDKVIKDKIKGSIYGLAVGDAWGFLTEFLTYDEIIVRSDEFNYLPQNLVVSDDTQMSIYNILAMGNILEKYSKVLDNIAWDTELQNKVRMEFANAQLYFYSDPLNTRAPGNACMTSLAHFKNAKWLGVAKTGLEGITAETKNSNGCGTIMRSGWLGLFPLSDEIIICLSILQAQITHGDPRGGITSAVQALLVKSFLNQNLSDFQDFVGSNVENCLKNYNKIFDAINAIKRVNSSLIDKNAVDMIAEDTWEASKKFSEWCNFPFGDMSNVFGAGWAADEALQTGFAAVNFSGGSLPADAFRRMVYTSGDSDSIAAIAGVMVGAFHGYDNLVEVFGEDFSSRFENVYQNLLQNVYEYIVSLY